MVDLDIGEFIKERILTAMDIKKDEPTESLINICYLMTMDGKVFLVPADVDWTVHGRFMNFVVACIAKHINAMCCVYISDQTALDMEKYGLAKYKLNIRDPWDKKQLESKMQKDMKTYGSIMNFPREFLHDAIIARTIGPGIPLVTSYKEYHLSEDKKTLTWDEAKDDTFEPPLLKPWWGPGSEKLPRIPDHLLKQLNMEDEGTRSLTSKDLDAMACAMDIKPGMVN